MSLSTNAVQRRVITVPVIVALAVGLTVTIPVWLLLSVIADGVRLRFRFPLARLLAFGVCWSWLELAGVSAAFGLWITGQRHNVRAHYALQRWWAEHLLGSLGRTCGITVMAENVQALAPGPALLFVRHASLADSLVSAHVIVNLAGMNPRFVLKRELLADPCLDIVGQRVPNHFLDRGANDSAPELTALRALVDGMGPRDIGVIFPEGTRANPDKRVRALAKIAERDPARAGRLGALRELLPPRPSGAQAMVEGAPHADVILAWHIGFEGLDTFSGILRALNRGVDPIRFVARRVPAADVPHDDAFSGWLDEQWLCMDADVELALAARRKGE
ncbi:MAG: hypothetical protein JWN62_1035 [Acidimicrobiales bacterium]|nr:hypothetical protein [Acidimicrobiales bacterium]